jgi:hypothetical protein
MKPCWLFYGDAWGFADFARRRQDDALKSLRSALEAVKRLRSAQPSVEYFLFSDTIVCVRELNEASPAADETVDKGFEEILVVVQFLISALLEADLLLRGVVTFGNLHREGGNEVIIGDALLDAAEFERKSVAPPLVFLPAPTLHKAQKAGKCSRNFFQKNLDRSVFVQTKDGGIIRAQALLGDKPDQLSKSLERALERMTVSEQVSPREAGALKAALDMVNSVIKNGRQQDDYRGFSRSGDYRRLDAKESGR